MRDRDRSYGQVFRDRICMMGIKEVVTAAHSPWQNAYVERVIGSVRRECLDYVIICDEHHLRACCRLTFTIATRRERISRSPRIARRAARYTRPLPARLSRSQRSTGHQTPKNRILLENYYLPGELEAKIGDFVAYYNHLRYHESIANLTPADVYFGRGQTILLERERIKLQTIQSRRLMHSTKAA